MSERQVPWGRLAAEFVVIVVGVLVALAADTWLEERDDRRTEQEILTRLSDEFATNAERLGESQEIQRDMLAAAEALFELTGPTTPAVEEDSVALLILDAMKRTTFTPVSGVLNSTVSTGQLGLVRDEALREELAAWPDLVRALNESEQAAWTDVDQHFIPYLSERLAWRTVDYLDGREAYDEPSRFEPGWMDVLRDRLFENLLGNHHTYTQAALWQSDSLAVRLDRITELVDRNLAR